MDSLNLHIHNVMYNPEYMEIDKELSHWATPEYVATQHAVDASLKQYQEAYNQAINKYNNTAAHKKYLADRERLGEISRQLKARKPKP